MGKQEMVQDVLTRLKELGISYETGCGADIAINCVFLDAGWSTGKKKIVYEASAYFDETEKTVFLWEYTKETGSGFSFGEYCETSFQTGKTLFRKVKSIQYGADGKAYEYTLNLGAIPEAFKVTAKAYGWKFKTVLKREKASYPPDIEQQGQQHHSSENDTAYAPQSVPANGQHGGRKREKRGVPVILFWVMWVFCALFGALMLIGAEADPAGIIIAAAIMLLIAVLRKKLCRKPLAFTLLCFCMPVLMLVEDFYPWEKGFEENECILAHHGYCHCNSITGNRIRC